MPDTPKQIAEQFAALQAAARVPAFSVMDAGGVSHAYGYVADREFLQHARHSPIAATLTDALAENEQLKDRLAKIRGYTIQGWQHAFSGPEAANKAILDLTDLEKPLTP